MNTISIEAATPESALGLYNALDGYRPELRTGDVGRRFIDVDVSGDCDIVEVLNAIENYVKHRDDGPARVAFAGRNYTLHAVE